MPTKTVSVSSTSKGFPEVSFIRFEGFSEVSFIRFEGFSEVSFIGFEGFPEVSFIGFEGFPEVGFATGIFLAKRFLGFPEVSTGFPEVSRGFPEVSTGFPEVSRGFPEVSLSAFLALLAFTAAAAGARSVSAPPLMPDPNVI